MIVPILLTAGILGGVYYFGQAPAVPRPENEPKPLPMPIPTSQIPPELQRRMQNAFVQLPPGLQAQLPQTQWADPNLWAQAAQILNQAQPGSPQSPELMAIANALRALPIPQPVPPPSPFPPTPIGPIPVPPQLQTQLNQVLAGLPPPFNQAIPSFPFPGQPSTGPLAPSIDPNALILLAQQVEAALPGRNEPAQLRAIAAQLSQSAAPAAPMGVALPAGGVNIGPAAANAASVYEEIIRRQGGTVSPNMSQVLSYLQQYGGTPPVAGVPAYYAPNYAPNDQMGAYPWWRRKGRLFR